MSVERKRYNDLVTAEDGKWTVQLSKNGELAIFCMDCNGAIDKMEVGDGIEGAKVLRLLLQELIDSVGRDGVRT